MENKLPADVQEQVFARVEKYLTLDKHHLTSNEAADLAAEWAEKWWEVVKENERLRSLLHEETMANNGLRSAYDEIGQTKETLRRENEDLKMKLARTRLLISLDKEELTLKWTKAQILANELQEEKQKLRAALEDIARQKTCEEQNADPDAIEDNYGRKLGDIEFGYDTIIEVAREALAEDGKEVKGD